MAERTCPGCGAEIPPGSRERNKRIWCSQACRSWRHNHPDGELRPAARVCQRCSLPIVGRNVRAVFCSRRCLEQSVTKLAHGERRACSYCGGSFAPVTNKQVYCSRPCQKIAYGREYRRNNPDKYGWSPAKQAAAKRRRARRKGATVGRSFLDAEIFERDGWRCQLCRKKVDPSLEWPHPMSKSLDHVVPLSKGGAHRAANVQLAHLTCNIAKRDRPQGEQLRLIG